MAELFILAPTRLLWEEFSHAAITAWRLFTHIPTAVHASHSFIQPSELGCRGENENAQASKQQQRWFEPGLSRSTESPTFYWATTVMQSVVVVWVCHLGLSMSLGQASRTASDDMSAIVWPSVLTTCKAWWVAVSWNSTLMEFSSSVLYWMITPTAFHTYDMDAITTGLGRAVIVRLALFIYI